MSTSIVASPVIFMYVRRSRVSQHATAAMPVQHTARPRGTWRHNTIAIHRTRRRHPQLGRRPGRQHRIDQVDHHPGAHHQTDRNRHPQRNRRPHTRPGPLTAHQTSAHLIGSNRIEHRPATHVAITTSHTPSLPSQHRADTAKAALRTRRPPGITWPQPPRTPAPISSAHPAHSASDTPLSARSNSAHPTSSSHSPPTGYAMTGELAFSINHPGRVVVVGRTGQTRQRKSVAWRPPPWPGQTRSSRPDVRAEAAWAR